MSIERMADRSLPLTERVEAAMSVQGTAAHDLTGLLISHALWAALLADIAAADRLARATDGFEASCLDITIRRIVPREHDEEGEWRAALDAYRARMAQGVARG